MAVALALAVCCVGLPLLIFGGRAIANLVSKQKSQNLSEHEQDRVRTRGRNGAIEKGER